MALWRLRSSKRFQFTSNRTIRAGDGDFDLQHQVPQRSTIRLSLSRLLRWMMPEGKTIRPPMRSVARELEETFPSDEY